MIAESRGQNLSFFFLAKKFEKDYLKRFRITSVSPQNFFCGSWRNFSETSFWRNFFRMGPTLMISIAGVRFA